MADRVTRRVTGVVPVEGLPWDQIVLNEDEAHGRGLITEAEFAASLGYARRTISQWRKKKNLRFPEPVAVMEFRDRRGLGTTPVFDGKQLTEWHRAALKGGIIHPPHRRTGDSQ